VSSPEDEKPHLPSPSLWPLGFAVGIACLLAGLVVSLPAAAVGALLAIVFGFLWIRDVTRGVDTAPAHVEPESRAPLQPTGAEAAGTSGGAMPVMEDEEVAAYPRSTFLSAATLGLGAAIGGVITVPVLGFAVLPSFTNQHEPNVELGPLDEFPEGKFVIATYLENPEIGEVSRRTVFVRNNGRLEDQPSFTVLFSRCVHLGCPVQPNGPVEEDNAKEVGEQNVRLIPAQPSGFGCPCHGGQYDTEGNRTAGPPVRALDRADFSIREGKLFLGGFYSVSEVRGTGARARIKKYGHAVPGVHVDGPSAWLYPIEVPG
jgi:Rieske Fe-S protein